MYLGWFCFGGNEIINNSRAILYARTAGCPVNWFDDEPTPSIRQMIEGAYEGYLQEPYDYSNIDEAPWFDLERAYRGANTFLGAYCISVDGLVDSTRSADMTERVGGGGVASRERYGSRRSRFRVLLTALDEQGLEYGTAWLNAALEEQGCQTHEGGSCGTTDITFYTQATTEEEMWSPTAPFGPEQIDGEVDLRVRRLHGVKCVSGPLVQRELRSETSPAVGRIVEFTLAAEQPFIYGIPIEVVDPGAGYTRVIDDPLNLVPVPSAQDTTGLVSVMTNYVINPSVETNNVGWAIVADGVYILGANVASSRSSELAASGAWSQKALWTAPGANAGPLTDAWFGNQQEVTLPVAPPVGTRFSINMWAASQIQAGAPVLGALEIYAYWRAGGVTLRADLLGTISGGSGVISRPSILPPSGATSVIVRSMQRLTSWNAGTIVRHYTDALAVTVP